MLALPVFPARVMLALVRLVLLMLLLLALVLMLLVLVLLLALLVLVGMRNRLTALRCHWKRPRVIWRLRIPWRRGWRSG